MHRLLSVGFSSIRNHGMVRFSWSSFPVYYILLQSLGQFEVTSIDVEILSLM